jgi:hypothetical protein
MPVDTLPKPILPAAQGDGDWLAREKERDISGNLLLHLSRPMTTPNVANDGQQSGLDNAATVESRLAPIVYAGAAVPLPRRPKASLPLQIRGTGADGRAFGEAGQRTVNILNTPTTAVVPEQTWPIYSAESAAADAKEKAGPIDIWELVHLSAEQLQALRLDERRKAEAEQILSQYVGQAEKQLLAWEQHLAKEREQAGLAIEALKALRA